MNFGRDSHQYAKMMFVFLKSVMGPGQVHCYGKQMARMFASLPVLKSYWDRGSFTFESVYQISLASEIKLFFLEKV